MQWNCYSVRIKSVLPTSEPMVCSHKLGFCAYAVKSNEHPSPLLRRRQMLKSAPSIVVRATTFVSVALAVAAIFLSCTESTSPPLTRLPSGRPSIPGEVAREMLSLPSSSVSLPFTGGSSTTIADYSAFTEGVLVDISITGIFRFPAIPGRFQSITPGRWIT